MILLAKAWVIGYLILALGVILGIVVVARPSGRKTEKVRRFSNV